MTAYLPFINLINNPVKLSSRSGPFSNFLFNDVALCLAAASNTTLILSGFFGFVTMVWYIIGDVKGLASNAICQFCRVDFLDVLIDSLFIFFC